MTSDPSYDAIVVGAGHAGVEAALAIARAGHSTLLITMSAETIAKMSCNPAIGGIAKGHMVREIDALGGEMGLAIDQTGIQFRMLNRSRGPAVWAPRAQADKQGYSDYMAAVIRSQKNLVLREGQVVALYAEAGKARGVRLKSGEEFCGRHVILTTGTFLQGRIHVGDENFPGGRTGEEPALGLSDSLRAHGIELVRFKTGTPPRLRAGTIDWSILEEQPGDNPPQPFSYRTAKLDVAQLSCFLTHTNRETHQILREHLHLSPLYAGRIVGTGPRYCPSIEDKVVKFADKERHQIYLEPEGRNTDEIYVNGLSMSLPRAVQERIVHSMTGLAKAEFIRYAYAIEYDCAPPTQLRHSLETKAVENLFLAGQINCTSGYEEAAGQGLVAGLNVIRKLRSEPPFVLDRSEAYLGVMIDDLVTVGTNEPYRMFTSRAEYRLLLRQDNADFRLMKYGHQFGLIDSETYQRSQDREERIRKEVKRIKKTWHQGSDLGTYLRRPNNSYKSLKEIDLHSSLIIDYDIPCVEAEIKYEGYIARQNAEVKRYKKLEHRKIPSRINYDEIKGISREAKEKLKKILPESIGQATRIPGLSQCDISLLAIFIEKNQKEPTK